MKQFLFVGIISIFGFFTQAQTTFEMVQERGELNCGVTGLDAGTLIKLTDGGILGLHAGFCQAVAVALLGDPQAILYVPLQASNAFAELELGNVDLLVGNNPLIASYDATKNIEYGPVVFHKDRVPYALVVRSGDDHWLDSVTWLAYSLIQAEEWDIRSDNVADVLAETDRPLVQSFLSQASGLDESLGLEPDALYEVIAQVGNYAELYERHLGENASSYLPRGLNNLYLNGGLHYSPPFSPR